MGGYVCELPQIGIRAGEPVRLAEEFFLRLLAIRDVCTDTRHALRFTLAVNRQSATRLKPRDFAIWENDPILNAIILSLFQRFSNCNEDPIPVFGMHVALIVFERSTERSHRKAVDGLQLRRPHYPARANIPLPRAHASGLQGQVEPGFALSER